MGMNYYLHTGRKVRKTCDLGCEHELDEVLHFGKSSYGRYFTMHEMTTDDGDVLDSLKSWKKYFEKKCPAGWFEDEDGTRVTSEFMWNCASRKGYKPSGYADEHFRKSMVGKPVDAGERPDFFGNVDVWGKDGFVHSSNAKVGKDGLYVLFTGDFS